MGESRNNSGELTEPGRQALVELLLEEHADAPWDDRRLSALLQDRGVQLGPRSVGRYRQRLAVPSSTERRHWDASTRRREMERLKSLVGLNGHTAAAGRAPQVPLPAAAPPATRPPDVEPGRPQAVDPEPAEATEPEPGETTDPELEDDEPVLFASDPPEASGPANEQRRSLSETNQDVLSGDRTLSNIPLILKRLLTPTAAPSGGVQPAAAEPEPVLEEPDAELLEAWKLYLEFRSEGLTPAEQAALESRAANEWCELTAEALPALDLGAELKEAGSILDRIFLGVELAAALEAAASEVNGPDIFLFIEEELTPEARPRAGGQRPAGQDEARTASDVDTDVLVARGPGLASAEPAPPRSRATESTDKIPVQPAAQGSATPAVPPELEDTRPERPAAGPSSASRRQSTWVPWSELWPFPKYRQLVQDIPVLSRLNLHGPTSLLRPLLTAKLREAHKLYREGLNAEAAEILEELATARSDAIRFWAHLLLGEIRLVHDASLPEARAHLEKAARLSGKAGRVQLLLAITLYLQDELQAACELLRRARGAAAPSPTGRLVLGLTLLELGDLSHGVAELEASRKKLRFTAELTERLRHAREILKAGVWSGPDQET